MSCQLNIDIALHTDSMILYESNQHGFGLCERSVHILRVNCNDNVRLWLLIMMMIDANQARGYYAIETAYMSPHLCGVLLAGARNTEADVLAPHSSRQPAVRLQR